MSGFKDLLGPARKHGWQAAVRDLYGPAEAYRWTVDDHCAAAPLLALPSPEARVLDPACGRGTHALALAGLCRAVYATDPDPDAVRFLSIRARQDGIRNLRLFLGRPEQALRPGSIDLLLLQGLPAPEDLNALLQLLKPGGSLCLGLANPDSPVCKTGRDSGAGYADLKSALASAGAPAGRIYAALPSHRDVRLLLHTDDARGLVRFLGQHFPSLPAPAFLRGILLRIFRKKIAPAYWAIASRAADAPGYIETTLHAAAGDRLPPHARVPILYANRGTFTLPVYAPGENAPRCVCRIDAARTLVHHEAAALKLLAERGDPELVRSVPGILWEGRLGSRSAALQTALPGRPLRLPRRPRDLERQLLDLSDWLGALSRVGIQETDLSNPSLSDLNAIYRDENRFREQIPSPEIADRFWNALNRLKASGLRPGLVHGDLHPGNILVHRNRIHVFDWEYALRAWPPFDWFHYICSIILDRHKRASASAENARALLQSAFDRHPNAGILGACTQRFLNQLDLPPEAYPDAFQIGLFDFIRRRYGPQALPVFLPLFQHPPEPGRTP